MADHTNSVVVSSGDGPLAGSADLIKKLALIGGLDDGKIIVSAVRAGLTEAKKVAIQKIPKGTRSHRTYKGRIVAPGFASRNIKIIVQRRSDKKGATAMLGVAKEAYYAVQFVERGTKKMAKQPWLRPAFYETADKQQSTMVAYLNKRFAKIAKDGTA